MPKLISPVQYGPGLNGLNELRPLSVGDDLDSSLSLPVADVNPADNSQLSAGHFLRSTDQGSMLRKLPFDLEDYSSQSIDHLFVMNETVSIIFAQAVQFAIGKKTVFDGSGILTWVTSAGSIAIHVFEASSYIYLPCKDQRIIVKATNMSGAINIKLIGFF